jgi:hypothetical protein
LGGGLGTTILGGQSHNIGSNSGLFSFVGGGYCNNGLGTINVVLGGCYNYACNCVTSIGGGVGNCVTRSASSIIGGCQNTINNGGNCNVIGGGTLNSISGSFSSIGGGNSNIIINTFGAIIGGSLNSIDGSYSFIGGGQLNCSTSDFSTILGGSLNKICIDKYNLNLGGSFNVLCGYSSTSSGYNNRIFSSNFSNNLSGQNNQVCSSNYSSNFASNNSIILNSNFSNTISSNNSCIDAFAFNDISGQNNCISLENSYNSVLNGSSNLMLGTICCNSYGLMINGNLNCTYGNVTCYQTILNGYNNVTNVNLGFIGNGLCNNLIYSDCNYGFSSTIIGGVGNNTINGTFDFSTFTFTSPPTNQNVGQYSFIGGGFQNNSVCQNFNSVVGGYCNENFLKNSFIGGGQCNFISLGNSSGDGYSSIVGGKNNLIDNGNNSYSFIGGGKQIKIFDDCNVIFGGCQNCILANQNPNFFQNIQSFIGGGKNNCIGGNKGKSVIFGGQYNVSYGTFNNIVGGQNNTIGSVTYNNCSFSNILGGCFNCICGNRSAILGGQYNCVIADDSFVLGSGISNICNCTTYVNNLYIVDTPTTCNPPNSINLGWDASTKKVVRVCDGTLTSFGLSSFDTIGSKDVGFCIVGSPISGVGACGSVCMTMGKGTDTQYLSGANSIINVPNVSSGGGVVYYMNGQIPSSVVGYEQLSTDPIVTNLTTFTSTTDGIISQFLTDVNKPNLQIIPNGVFVIRAFFSVDLGTPDVNALLYSYDGSTFTLLNTGDSVNINQGGDITQYTMTVPLTNPPLFSPTTRFAIALNVSNITGTGAILTQYTQDIYLNSVSTTFPSGLGALNSLICTSQIFKTTTDANGDVFNITSSVDTHCFNLPTASSTQCGALSCQDWGIFNSRQNTIIPAQSFYVNPTSSVATAIFCKYFSCVSKCLDTNVSWTPSSANVAIVPPTKSVQSGEYTIMRMGSMVYYCFTIWWQKGVGKDGTISATSTATNITVNFLNPSDVPQPCTSAISFGQNTFNTGIGEIILAPDECMGNYFSKMVCPPTSTSIVNVFQRMGIVCCTTCPQLPNLSGIRGILSVPYPSTFNYLSGSILYQAKP